MSGSLPAGIPDVSKLLAKPQKNAAASGEPGTGTGTSVPQVPLHSTVESPRRRRGKGRRDTIPNGADGLPE